MLTVHEQNARGCMICAVADKCCCIPYSFTIVLMLSLDCPVTYAIVGPAKHTSANKLRAIIMLVTVFGLYVATRLETANHTGEPYLNSKLIAGAGTTACCLLSIWLKLRVNDQLLAKV